MVLVQQQFGWVAHLAQSVLPHFVNSQFGSASEAVLDAAQDAVHIMLVALELEYGIHDMFQYLGAGYASFLIDMPDKDDRRMRFLGKAQDGGGTFPYLGDAPRRRFKGFGRNCLYGVDDDYIRANIFDVDVNLFQGSFAHDEAVTGGACQAVGTQFQLAGAFFAGYIENTFFRYAEYGL